MKYLFKYLLLFFISIMLFTGCGKNSLEQITISLLDSIKKDKVSEHVIEHCNNIELLNLNQDDPYEIKKLIFSKMTYKIIKINENKTEGTITLQIKTIDIDKIFDRLQNDLMNDQKYLKLQSEEMKKYSLEKEKELIDNINDEGYRIALFNLTANKENGVWKINLNDQFVNIISGLNN